MGQNFPGGAAGLGAPGEIDRLRLRANYPGRFKTGTRSGRINSGSSKNAGSFCKLAAFGGSPFHGCTPISCFARYSPRTVGLERKQPRTNGTHVYRQIQIEQLVPNISLKNDVQATSRNLMRPSLFSCPGGLGKSKHAKPGNPSQS